MSASWEGKINLVVDRVRLEWVKPTLERLDAGSAENIGGTLGDGQAFFMLS